MKGLIALLSVLAPLSVIITAWWNLAIRRKVAEARVNHLTRDTVESKFARWARRVLTTLVLIFVSSAIITGTVIFIKTLWELF